MIRVLEVFREPIANGGQESFLMNMYRNLDRDQVQMDFMTPFCCENERIRKEIESLGGQVFTYDHEFGKNNNRVFKKCVKDFLKSHSYTIVHFHSGSTYALMEGSKLAAKAGVPNRIVHSHSCGFDNLKYRVIRLISRGPLLKYPTAYWACSDVAAQWKFPEKIISGKQYEVIKNAVDLRRFHFDESWRKFARKDLGISDSTFVVGHVGRFSFEKNHSFLIDIFDAVHQKEPDSVLLLAGAGELEQEIRQKVNRLGLDGAVQFLGVRQDIPDLMNAMDIFILPSFFEGLPVVGVEAQATGLPVVTSTGVARELPVESLADYLPLEDSPQRWAEVILSYRHQNRKDMRNEMARCGYEVRAAAHHLQQLYLEMAGQK